MQRGRLKVVQTLRSVNIIQRLDCFDFDDDSSIDEEIGDKIPDQYVSVSNFDSLLLDNLKSGLSKFNREGVFINFLEKPRAESVAYLMGAADDFLCDLIQP